MFFKGVFTFLIHCFIILPILFFTGKIKFEFLWNNIILIIIYICLFFPDRIVIMRIIYIFSPIHLGFLHVIYFCSHFFFENHIANYDFSNIDFGIYIGSLIIIIFGELLFCEILIINICGLKNNTKPGFLQKVELERLNRNSSTTEDDVYLGQIDLND